MKVTDHVPPLGPHHKFMDKAMLPLMYVLGRAKSDSIQETHPWHVHSINPEQVDDTLSVAVTGEKEAVSDRFGPLFHMFGGWKHYVTLEAEPPFHIGWVFYKQGQDEPSQSAVNRLLIEDTAVRMLTGPQGSETRFFATTPEGEQIRLRKIGQGTLGDHKFPGTRLL